MGHPVIDEIGRVYSLDRIQVHAFRRWQRVLKSEVQPMLDELERLRAENSQLKARFERPVLGIVLPDGSVVEPESESVAFGSAAEQFVEQKRKPGRPRKAVSA